MTDAKDSGIADDPHNLSRFVHAQVDVYEQALAEISSGKKETHWMWYIFPQFNGLGFGSPDDTKLRSCATLFAIVSPRGSVFEQLLDKYFQGGRDGQTLSLLANCLAKERLND